LVADLTRRIGSGWEAKGSGPRYDAAGLLRAATRAAWGRDLPDTPAAIERLTRPVAIRDLRVGDLVFYGEPAVHVGIYVGNGEMIDASKVLKKVSRRRVFSSETVRFARLR
jgi:peptidoglycan DL-endopeptidase CwlO